MKPWRVLFLLLIWPVCWTCFSACADPTAGHRTRSDDLLPFSDRSGLWQPLDQPSVFEGEALFVYINGGADIYYEYGFRKVTVQEYENPQGVRIGLEIYEMEDDRAAFGIYTFKRSSRGKAVSLGNGGVLESYYLNFWKKNVLVTLTGFDEGTETREGLLTLAESVDARIASGGAEPGLVARLPEEGLVSLSQQYFTGHLGLYNCFPFFSKDVFTCLEGVKGDYEGGGMVFLLRYADDRTCRERFHAVKDLFRKSEAYTVMEEKDDLFQAQDRDGRVLKIRPRADLLVIGMGKGADALNRLEKKVLDKLGRPK